MQQGSGGMLRTVDAEELLDALDEVVFATDAAGNWTYLSAAWTRLTGFPVHESLGTNFLDYVHPDERERTLALVMAVVAGGADHCHHEGYYLTADGGCRLVELRATVIRDEYGAVVGNTGTLVDLTRRRRAEEALHEDAQVVELVAQGDTLWDLPIGLLVVDAELRVLRASPVVERLLGVPVPVGIGLAELSADFTGPGGDVEEWSLVPTALRTGRPQYGELALRPRSGGRALAVQTSVLPIPGVDGRPSTLVLLLHDVTELRRAESQQAALAALGQQALDTVSLGELFRDAVAVVAATLETDAAELFEALPGDPDPVPVAVWGQPDLPRARAASHRAATETTARQALALAAPVATPPPAPGGWSGTTLAALVGGTRHTFGVLQTHASDGREFDADETSFLQAVANVLATAIGRRRLEEEAHYQALHDPLTGLANRLLLRDRLELALRAADRERHSLALLLADLDRFKEINDTLGHDVGDEVLRVVAARLQEATRATDTVARLGGDEFVVLLPSVTDLPAAMAVADKLHAVLGELISVGGVALHVQASIGVAVAPLHGRDAGQLLKRADVAMYRAKRDRAGVAAYDWRQDENTPERLALVTGLRRAIEQDELLLHYQPKARLRTGEVTGVEALARWQHPRDGLLPPSRFIPLAEQSGLIKPLTDRVLAVAIRQATRWCAAGRPMPVAVNLSAQMLLDPELVPSLVAELDRCGLPPELLQLELTESAVMAPEGALETILQLHAAGIHLSIDDFGTGYSSLTHLRDLPVQELKIDQSFVRDLVVDARDTSIVRSIIDLGHALQLRVVAEGIETRAGWQRLAELGCDEGQGYFCGRPVPPAQIMSQRSTGG